MSNKKKMVTLLAINALVLVLLLVVIIIGNQKQINITVDGGDHVYAEWGEDFTEPSVHATFKDGWNKTPQMTQVLRSAGDVDTMKVGDYTLTYTAEYKGKKAEKKVTVTVRDTKAPIIQLTGGLEVIVRPGASYEEQGYTATDNRDGDITSRVNVEEQSDKIIYTVTDESGNSTSCIRTIIYRDNTAPVITLNGEETILLEVNGKYEEKGASASDDTDGDLTARIQVSGSVDTGKPGAYEIKYTVTDDAGNSSFVIRNVLVRDTEAPVLTLAGDKKLYVKRGETFKDPGYEAIDAIEGNLTQKVTVTGTVDTGKLGVYTLTYTVKDSFDNETTETRDVYVYIRQDNVESVDPGNKVIYLTFDDGPGKYTQQLLDVLDKYNIKVTFFVTGQFPKYLDMIKKCDDAGHTIALHTYTHDYETIYTTSAGYFADLQRIADVVKKQTGKDASIIRFPGGSSNAVSKKYWIGAMTTLTQQVQDMGYRYVDWNVTSNDADGKSNKMELSEATRYVIDSTIKGIKARNGKYSVVLQHDIHLFSVNAVEEIILWGLENGYTFLPMTDESPMWHHHLNN